MLVIGEDERADSAVDNFAGGIGEFRRAVCAVAADHSQITVFNADERQHVAVVFDFDQTVGGSVSRDIEINAAGILNGNAGGFVFEEVLRRLDSVFRDLHGVQAAVGLVVGFQVCAEFVGIDEFSLGLDCLAGFRGGSDFGQFDRAGVSRCVVKRFVERRRPDVLADVADLQTRNHHVACAVLNEAQAVDFIRIAVERGQIEVNAIVVCDHRAIHIVFIAREAEVEIRLEQVDVGGIAFIRLIDGPDPHITPVVEHEDHFAGCRRVAIFVFDRHFTQRGQRNRIACAGVLAKEVAHIERHRVQRRRILSGQEEVVVDCGDDRLVFLFGEVRVVGHIPHRNAYAVCIGGQRFTRCRVNRVHRPAVGRSVCQIQNVVLGIERDGVDGRGHVFIFLPGGFRKVPGEHLRVAFRILQETFDRHIDGKDFDVADCGDIRLDGGSSRNGNFAVGDGGDKTIFVNRGDGRIGRRPGDGLVSDRPRVDLCGELFGRALDHGECSLAELDFLDCIWHQNSRERAVIRDDKCGGVGRDVADLGGFSRLRINLQQGRLRGVIVEVVGLIDHAVCFVPCDGRCTVVVGHIALPAGFADQDNIAARFNVCAFEGKELACGHFDHVEVAFRVAGQRECGFAEALDRADRFDFAGRHVNFRQNRRVQPFAAGFFRCVADLIERFICRGVGKVARDVVGQSVTVQNRRAADHIHVRNTDVLRGRRRAGVREQIAADIGCACRERGDSRQVLDFAVFDGDPFAAADREECAGDIAGMGFFEFDFIRRLVACIVEDGQQELLAVGFGHVEIPSVGFALDGFFAWDFLGQNRRAVLVEECDGGDVLVVFRSDGDAVFAVDIGDFRSRVIDGHGGRQRCAFAQRFPVDAALGIDIVFRCQRQRDVDFCAVRHAGGLPVHLGNAGLLLPGTAVDMVERAVDCAVVEVQVNFAGFCIRNRHAGGCCVTDRRVFVGVEDVAVDRAESVAFGVVGFVAVIRVAAEGIQIAARQQGQEVAHRVVLRIGAREIRRTGFSARLEIPVGTLIVHGTIGPVAVEAENWDGMRRAFDAFFGRKFIREAVSFDVSAAGVVVIEVILGSLIELDRDFDFDAAVGREFDDGLVQRAEDQVCVKGRDFAVFVQVIVIELIVGQFDLADCIVQNGLCIVSRQTFVVADGLNEFAVDFIGDDGR